MYDVIVIGAGPAGCTAAKTLAERGRKTLLAERFSLPRNKSCSGQLISRTVDLITRYCGESVPPSVMCAPAESCGMIFTDDNGKEYRFEQAGLNIWRSSFDKWLADKAEEAGADIRERTSVISCTESDGAVTVTFRGRDTFTEKARYVINCGGAADIIGKKLIGSVRRYVTTFQTFNTGNVCLDSRYFHAYLQPQLSQYDAWFNVKDGMLIFGTAVRDTDNTDSYYRSFIRYMESEHGLRLGKTLRAEKWIMPHIRPNFDIEYGTGRVIFAGESAGFLNPMGEGISSAIESGYAAAISVSDNFDSPDKVCEDYRRRTAPLKNYMERQWRFVAGISDRFRDFR